MTSYFFLHLLHWGECSKNQASSTLILVGGPLKREHIQLDFRDNNPTIQHLQLLIDFLVLLTFFRLIGLLPKCDISSRHYFSCHLLSDIPVIYSAIFTHFCQCISLYFQWYFHLIFSKLLFNYLVQSYSSYCLPCYYSIVKTELIYCYLFSFNRIAGVYCDWCTGTFMWILKTRSGVECEYMSKLQDICPMK